MSGLPQFNVAAFREAAIHLRELGYEVVSPCELDDVSGIGEAVLANANGDVSKLTAETGETWGSLLARDVHTIADHGIEGIVCLPGWHRSKGAKLEVFVGLLKQIPIFLYMDAPRLPHELRRNVVLEAIYDNMKERS